MQRATMLHPAAIPAASRVDDGCVSMGKRTPTSKERAVQEGVPRCRAGLCLSDAAALIPASAESGRVGGRALSHAPAITIVDAITKSISMGGEFAMNKRVEVI